MRALPEIRTVLAVGGLDPSGGAGLLLDAAAIRSLGLHAAAVATVLTVQDGRRFVAARVEEPRRVAEAIRGVLESADVGAVKTGALGNEAIVEALAELASAPGFPPLVVDPVVRSTSGGELLDARGVDRLRARLLPLATLITPNSIEAGILAGVEIRDARDADRAAGRLLDLGARAVLLKGGHLPGSEVRDLLVLSDGPGLDLRCERSLVAEARGTGCALAALIAGEIALGVALPRAVEVARAGLLEALGRAARIGSGPAILRFAVPAGPAVESRCGVSVKEAGD
jgi:hydroxymethylpyrimidine/phosphomethylpyrimidine kinase